MENITFFEKINLFLKNKRPRKPLAYLHWHKLTHTTSVLETNERQVFCINFEVWKESHII